MLLGVVVDEKKQIPRGANTAGDHFDELLGNSFYEFIYTYNINSRKGNGF